MLLGRMKGRAEDHVDDRDEDGDARRDGGGRGVVGEPVLAGLHTVGERVLAHVEEHLLELLEAEALDRDVVHILRLQPDRLSLLRVDHLLATVRGLVRVLVLQVEEAHDGAEARRKQQEHQHHGARLVEELLDAALAEVAPQDQGGVRGLSHFGPLAPHVLVADLHPAPAAD